MTDSEYQKEIEKIFTKFPSFQIVGGVAYKPGLDNMFEIDKELGFPSKKFRSVHVAGTNGKGSVSHMIASALMQLPSASLSLRRRHIKNWFVHISASCRFP
jgi:dihydrofolate synthase/folylpolyglutamate synthase